VKNHTNDQTQWTDLYLRHQFDDTGLYPTNGAQSASPDVIPSGDSPYSDPSQLITDTNWSKDFGNSTNASQANYIYLRGVNGNTTAKKSGKSYLYYSPASLLLWPTDPTDPTKGWSKNPLRTSSGAQYIDVSAEAGKRFNTPEPFQWIPTPISNDHYCLIARLVTADNPNPIPALGTLTDFAAYISQHPNMAWRNVVTINPAQAVSTTSVDYSQGQEGGYVYMNLRCTNAPDGSAVSLNCATPGPNPLIYIPQTEVKNPAGSSQFAITLYTNIPANFRSNITYSWYSNGKTPLPDMQFVLDPVMPVSSNSPLMRFARPLEHFGISTAHLKPTEPKHGIRLGSQTMQSPPIAPPGPKVYSHGKARSAVGEPTSSIIVTGVSWLERSSSILGSQTAARDVSIQHVPVNDVETQVVTIDTSTPDPSTKPADLVLDSDFNNGDHAGDTQVAMTAVGVPTGAEIWFQNQDGSVTIAVAPQRVTSDPFTVSTFVTLEANYSVKMQTFLRLNGTVLPSTWNLKFEALAISSDVPEAQRPKPITVVNGGPHKGTLLGRVTVKD